MEKQGENLNPPDPERFAEFELDKSSKGFFLPSGEYFEFDKYNGFYDEFGNYYDKDGAPGSPPHNDDDDYEDCDDEDDNTEGNELQILEKDIDDLVQQYEGGDIDINDNQYDFEALYEKQQKNQDRKKLLRDELIEMKESEIECNVVYKCKDAQTLREFLDSSTDKQLEILGVNSISTNSFNVKVTKFSADYLIGLVGKNGLNMFFTSLAEDDDNDYEDVSDDEDLEQVNAEPREVEKQPNVEAKKYQEEPKLQSQNSNQTSGNETTNKSSKPGARKRILQS